MVSENIKSIHEKEWKESSNLTIMNRFTLHSNGEFQIQVIEIDDIPTSEIRNMILDKELTSKKTKRSEIFEIGIPDKIFRKLVLQYISDYDAKRHILIRGIMKRNFIAVSSVWIGSAEEISRTNLK